MAADIKVLRRLLNKLVTMYGYDCVYTNKDFRHLQVAAQSLARREMSHGLLKVDWH